MRKSYQFWLNPENEENTSSKDLSPTDQAMNNLIKMKEATKLLKASAPTVRKYARLGRYKEYRFGEKLVFYDKSEILEYIRNSNSRSSDE
jgi:predicted DNA-binding transcriptional regulator AlpA